jgi:DNA-binding NtrC family response regulator/tetratricopeptide (TPR) repeat protein
MAKGVNGVEPVASVRSPALDSRVMSASLMLGESAGIVALREQVHRLVQLQSRSRRWPPVLIEGETGVGKGLLARILHDAGVRAERPFVDVACAAIPDTLLEAELFGFARGAFTDARHAKPGLFHAAHGGTLFLDEVGLLPLGLQAKLLKAVEEGAVRRLGSTRNEAVDAWILAATNEDLAAATRERRFREDLYHRLAAVRLALPPLRERGEDILRLAEHFLAHACTQYGLAPRRLGEDAQTALRAYPWPGNVRELANVIERVVLLSAAPVIGADALQLPPPSGPPGGASSARDPMVELKASLATSERAQLLDALREARGNVSRAAERLGLSRSTLRYRLARLGASDRPARSSARKLESRQSQLGAGVGRPGLAPPPAPGTPIAVRPPATSWDRRQVALLRITLGPSPATAWSTRARSLDVCSAKIRSFGGRVEQRQLEGILAAFGLDPVEDAPIRAVLAAMTIRNALGHEMGSDSRLASAVVHVGPLGIGRHHQEVQINGDDLAEAAMVLDELVRHAEPDTIVVSAAAARYVSRRFDLEDSLRASHGRIVKAERVHPLSGLTRLVGREAELQQLRNALAKTQAGHGQVVSVVGEAGLGKSRLVHELTAQLSRDGVPWFEGSCFAYGDSISYLPFLRIVKETFGLEGLASEAEAKQQMAQNLAMLDLDPGVVLPYLHNLLAYPVEDKRFQKLPPHLVRERTVQALQTLVMAMAARHPLVLIIEDVHWIDKATEETVGAIVEAMPTVPLLLLLVYRPEYLHPWATKAYHAEVLVAHLPSASSAEMVRAILHKSYASRVQLPPLTTEQSSALVQELLGTASVPAELERLVATTTNGNPLFIEELTLSLLESGDLVRRNGGYVMTQPTEALSVPPSLQGVLLTRIDRLHDELKAVLQVGSVIGRVFGHRVLARAVDRPTDLDDRLLELEDLEFIYPSSMAPRREYSFKHVLTQQAVYETLPHPTREALHERVARALEELSVDHAEEHYEVLAYHYSRSADSSKAVEYLDLANQKAAKANAVVEAKAYFDDAMRLLDGMPQSTLNHRRRISLLVNQSVVFQLLFQTNEYHSLLTQYEPVALAVGDDPGLVGAFYSCLSWCQFACGSFDDAIHTATQAARLCESAGNAREAGSAYVVRQFSHVYKGQFDHASADRRHVRYAMERWLDFHWLARSFAAASVAYTWMGCWEEAVTEGKRGVRLGEEFSDVPVVIMAATVTAIAYLARGDLDHAYEYSELIAKKARTPLDQLFAQSVRACVQCRAMDSSEGADALAQFVSVTRASGFVPSEWITPFLGEGYWRAGKYDMARHVLEELVEISDRHGMRYLLGSAHRLLGEVAVSSSDPAQINASRAAWHFEQSMPVLRDIKAENELALAFVGCGRLHKCLGRVNEARDYLGRALEILDRLGTLVEPDKVRAELAALPSQ